MGRRTNIQTKTTKAEEDALITERHQRAAANAVASALGNKNIRWTPELLKEKWAAEERGEEWKHPSQRPGEPVAQSDPVLVESVPPGAAQRAERTMSVLPQPANARDMRARMDDLLKKYGVEPAEELIKLATAVNEAGQLVLDNEDRITIWAKLLEYRMPKLKSVEHEGHVDHSMTVVVRKFGTTEETPVRRLVGATPDTILVEATPAT